MRRIKTRFVSFVLIILVVVAALPSTPALAEGNHASHFDDEYVFATTRGLNEMEGVHPALKLPLFPVTIVLDIVFLPFAIIAGFVAG